MKVIDGITLTSISESGEMRLVSSERMRSPETPTESLPLAPPSRWPMLLALGTLTVVAVLATLLLR